MKDVDLKIRVAEPSFANGMMRLFLDEHKTFFASGKTFKVIPEVATVIKDANEAECEYLVEALSDHPLLHHRGVREVEAPHEANNHKGCP